MRKTLTAFITVLALICFKQAVARIDTGTIDTRIIDTRTIIKIEEWAKPPYNMVVRLQSDSICTGSFVAPNLILTASHCVNSNGDADITVYTATSGEDGFTATKVYDSNWEYDRWASAVLNKEYWILPYLSNDSAIYLVNDPKYYNKNNEWFEIVPKSMNYKNVRSLGFGNLRPLNNNEIVTIRETIVGLLEERLLEEKKDNRGDCQNLSDASCQYVAMGTAEKLDIRSANDFTKKIVAALPSWIPDIFGDHQNLKVSGPCDILGEEYGYLYHNCDGSQGNSGGPISVNLLTSAPTIVGISSVGVQTLGSDKHINFSRTTKPEHFYPEVKKRLPQESAYENKIQIPSTIVNQQSVEPFPESKQTGPLTCPTGQYLINNNCTNCEPGYKCPGDGTLVACSEPLEYQDFSGRSSCKNVIAGYYKFSNKQSLPCPEGYQDGPPATNINDCKPKACEPGEFWDGITSGGCTVCDYDPNRCPGVSNITYGTRLGIIGIAAVKKASNLPSEIAASSQTPAPQKSEELNTNESFTYAFQFGEFSYEEMANAVIKKIKNLFPNAYFRKENGLYKVRANVSPDKREIMHDLFMRMSNSTVYTTMINSVKCSGLGAISTDFVPCKLYLY